MGNKLMKNVQNFVEKKDSRPILKGIHFSSDGNLYATNSHIAIMLEGYNDSKQEMVIDPKSLEQLSGQYPHVSRLISTSFSNSFGLSLESNKLLLNFLKPFKKSICCLSFDSEKTIISIDDVSFLINENKNEQVFNVYLKSEYLIYVTQLFIDEKLKMQFHIDSPLKPILIESGSIKTIISPIRKGE